MHIELDLTSLLAFFQLPLDVILWRFMAYYGWIIIGILLLIEIREMWLLYVQDKFARTVKYVMLAVDIPLLNEQSPRAVENLFTYLGGAHKSISFFEKYWEGLFQLSFSFEIVSIDGYTQFLIRTPSDLKALIESAVYSQYPDAEISEVDDYTEGMPRKFPNEEYELFGSEFIQTANQMYPIKMYEEFEHKLGPDETYFKDPMASLMDMCSSLQKGEQFWFQIIVVPIGFDWMGEADDEIDKIVGKKPKTSLLNTLVDGTMNVVDSVSESVYSLWGDVEDREKEFKPKSMVELRPKEKRRVEGLHMKVSKLGFRAKFRIIYLAKKEVFNSKKVVNGFVGYVKQFVALDLNNLKPDLDYTFTSTSYFNRVNRANTRKTKIINNYIHRDPFAGRFPGIFNIAELATIWHFPMSANVRAPLIQKATMKKGKPPMSLPSEESLSVEAESLEPIYSISGNSGSKAVESNSSDKEGGLPPANLPFG
jgi:hypothetical protein